MPPVESSSSVAPQEPTYTLDHLHTPCISSGEPGPAVPVLGTVQVGTGDMLFLITVMCAADVA